MKKKNLLILIIAIGLIILVVIIGLIILTSSCRCEKVKITTKEKEYKIGDTLSLKIENNLKEKICFASCYPYYFEKKDGVWKSYYYDSCPSDNLVASCLDSKQTKGFELTIPSVKTGFHRLAIPVCIDCKLNDPFKEERWFYSNIFTIK